MALERLVDGVVPVACAGCDAPGWAVCPACVERVAPAPRLPPLPGIAHAAAVLAYSGTGRDVVARLKYRRRRRVAAWIAPAMAELARPWAPDLVTPVPTSASRRRARGLDHAALLATEVGGVLGVRVASTMKRAPSPAQTGRAAADRMDGPDLRPGVALGGTVLVVDDVITTGATLVAAAEALAAAGARQVVAVAAAATP
jgi:predicted amidophosphoribosyltransferase